MTIVPAQEHISVTARQNELLMLLLQDEPWSIGEIASALGVSSAAATKAVMRLERKGLLTRTKNGVDGRCVDVRLAPTVREMVHLSDPFKQDEGTTSE